MSQLSLSDSFEYLYMLWVVHCQYKYVYSYSAGSTLDVRI